MPRRQRHVDAALVGRLARSHERVVRDEREIVGLPDRERFDAGVCRRRRQILEHEAVPALDFDRIADGRVKQRQRRRERAGGACEIEGCAFPALRLQWTDHGQTRQTGGFRFLGDRRRREESRAVGQTTRPRSMAQQSGKAWADKRAELAVLVEPRACRHGEPSRHIDIVLHEHTRDGERVREPRKIDRLKTIAFDRDAADQRMRAERAAKGDFAEACIVIVAFGNLSVLMILPL